jgi:hypothetical protein
MDKNTALNWINDNVNDKETLLSFMYNWFDSNDLSDFVSFIQNEYESED